MMKQFNFWIYLEREFTDLMPEFEKILGVNNLYRDYESTWEWIESKDRKARYFINIRRSHNWKQGDYNEPIHITIEPTTGQNIQEEYLAKLLKDGLHCDVFACEVSHKDGKVLFEGTRKF